MFFKGRNSISKLIGPYEGIGFQERDEQAQRQEAMFFVHFSMGSLDFHSVTIAKCALSLPLSIQIKI